MNKRIFKSVAGIIVLVAVIGVVCIESQSISMERDLNLNKVVIITIKKLLK